MSSSGEVVCEGWLRKSPPEKKLRRHAWKRRWFVLRSGKMTGDPDVLQYYKHHQAKKPIKTINLDLCEQVDAGLSFTKQDVACSFVFDLKTEDRVWYLVADSQQDMDTWVSSICQLCGFNPTDQVNERPRPDSTPSPVTTATTVGHAPSSTVTVMASSVPPPYDPVSVRHLEVNRNIEEDYLWLDQCQSHRPPLVSSDNSSSSSSSPSPSSLLPNGVAPPPPSCCTGSSPWTGQSSDSATAKGDLDLGGKSVEGAAAAAASPRLLLASRPLPRPVLPSSPRPVLHSSPRPVLHSSPRPVLHSSPHPRKLSLDFSSAQPVAISHAADDPHTYVNNNAHNNTDNCGVVPRSGCAAPPALLATAVVHSDDAEPTSLQTPPAPPPRPPKPNARAKGETPEPERTTGGGGGGERQRDETGGRGGGGRGGGGERQRDETGGGESLKAVPTSSTCSDGECYSVPKSDRSNLFEFSDCFNKYFMNKGLLPLGSVCSEDVDAEADENYVPMSAATTEPPLRTNTRSAPPPPLPATITAPPLQDPAYVSMTPLPPPPPSDLASLGRQVPPPVHLGFRPSPPLGLLRAAPPPRRRPHPIGGEAAPVAPPPAPPHHQPPPVHRNLKPQRKAKPLPLDITPSQDWEEVPPPVHSPVTRTFTRDPSSRPSVKGGSAHSSSPSSDSDDPDDNYVAMTTASSLQHSTGESSLRLMFHRSGEGGASSPALRRAREVKQVEYLDLDLHSTGPTRMNRCAVDSGGGGVKGVGVCEERTTACGGGGGGRRSRVDYALVDPERTQALRNTREAWHDGRVSTEKDK